MLHVYKHLMLSVVLLVILNGFTERTFASEDDCEMVFECYETEVVEGTDEENEGEPSQSENLESISFDSGQSFLSLLLQMIIALAIVIGLIIFLLRFVNKKTRSFRSNQTVENLGGASVGANRSVQVVKIGETLLIVGVGENVQLLKEITDEKEIDKLLLKHEQELQKLEQTLVSATAWMKQFRKKRLNENKLEFGELLNKQLNDVSHSQKKIHEAMKEHKHD